MVFKEIIGEFAKVYYGVRDGFADFMASYSPKHKKVVEESRKISTLACERARDAENRASFFERKYDYEEAKSTRADYQIPQLSSQLKEMTEARDLLQVNVGKLETELANSKRQVRDYAIDEVGVNREIGSAKVQLAHYKSQISRMRAGARRVLKKVINAPSYDCAAIVLDQNGHRTCENRIALSSFSRIHPGDISGLNLRSEERQVLFIHGEKYHGRIHKIEEGVFGMDYLLEVEVSYLKRRSVTRLRKGKRANDSGDQKTVVSESDFQKKLEQTREVANRIQHDLELKVKNLGNGST